MTLDQHKLKQLRAIGHKLNPVVIVGENGLSENLFTEINRALQDHELIKIKIASNDRDARQLMLAEAESTLKFNVIQKIGKIALIYKPAKEPNKKLSNLHRPI